MNRRQKMIETLSSLLSSKKNRYKRDPPNVVASMLRGKFRGIGYWLPKLVETNDLVPPPPPSGVQHPYLHDISCNNGSALPQTVLSPGEREERNDASTRNVNESFSEREGGGHVLLWSGNKMVASFASMEDRNYRAEKKDFE